MVQALSPKLSLGRPCSYRPIPLSFEAYVSVQAVIRRPDSGSAATLPDSQYLEDYGFQGVHTYRCARGYSVSITATSIDDCGSISADATTYSSPSGFPRRRRFGSSYSFGRSF